MTKFILALSGFSTLCLSGVLAVSGGSAPETKPMIILRGLSAVASKNVVEVLNLIVDGESTTVERKLKIVVEKDFPRGSTQLEKLQDILRSGGPGSDEMDEFIARLCREKYIGYKPEDVVKGLSKIESEAFKPEAIQINMKIRGLEGPVDSIDGPILVECED